MEIAFPRPALQFLNRNSCRTLLLLTSAISQEPKLPAFSIMFNKLISYEQLTAFSSLRFCLRCHDYFLRLRAAEEAGIMTNDVWTVILSPASHRMQLSFQKLQLKPSIIMRAKGGTGSLDIINEARTRVETEGLFDYEELGTSRAFIHFSSIYSHEFLKWKLSTQGDAGMPSINHDHRSSGTHVHGWELNLCVLIWKFPCALNWIIVRHMMQMRASRESHCRRLFPQIVLHSHYEYECVWKV